MGTSSVSSSDYPSDLRTQSIHRSSLTREKVQRSERSRKAILYHLQEPYKSTEMRTERVLSQAES